MNGKKLFMTREEQIIAEAKKHYYDDINCHNAFLHGVEWADEHPVDVWHDASEVPAGRDWRILCEDESGKCWVASRRDAFTIGYNWQEFAEDEALTRWAYIKDLLPKGGK